ncbi:hypothetical protein [Martelella limonii]|uniref:hypothetical protein n=1 Tax=Martelella limonii TaxID=1647649 RepID=UPI001580B02F|nr:hypothetical protein [Martelella limonii]
MHDVFLKFADHTQALATLEAAGIVIRPSESEVVRITYHDTGLPVGMLIVKAVGAVCDGTVYQQTGETETDAEGFEYPVMAAVEGFHVNIRIEDGADLPEALSAFEVAPEPTTPAERFA